MKPAVTTLAVALIACSVFTLSVQADQPDSILGKTDIHALLDAAPGMPSSTAEAATRAYGSDIRASEVPASLSTLYDPFYKRVAAAKQQISDAAAARAKGMPSQAAVEKQAKADANANPIVSGMGGVDNIQQMDQAQREQAARAAAEKYKQDLVTGGGRNSPGMQAMMQKVMNDPEYRARFQKMSEQEKEAEIRKYMGNAPPQSRPQTPAEQQQVEQRAQTKNEVSNAMGIQQDMNQMLQRMGEIDTKFAEKDQAITAAKGSHDDIAREIGAKIEKVPIVELGEYGKDRDPALVVPLLREEATRNRERAAWELKERTALYAQRKAQYQELVSAYHVWLKQNQGRINTSAADLLHGTNTELAVAGYEQALIGLSESLGKYSEETTKDAARYERQYQDKMSGSNTARSGRATKPRN